MTTGSSNTVATSCSYCGRENSNRLPACAGCGTPLSSEPPASPSQPRRKSKPLAVILALILGPLGLFYASIPAGLTMILVALALRLIGVRGWWIMIGARIVCACWAFHALREDETALDSSGDANQLLDAAAQLENVDRAQALAAYETLIRKFPNTRASREAQRNIQTLSKSQGTDDSAPEV